jgi:hypothetical protein
MPNPGHELNMLIAEKLGYKVIDKDKNLVNTGQGPRTFDPSNDIRDAYELIQIVCRRDKLIARIKTYWGLSTPLKTWGVSLSPIGSSDTQELSNESELQLAICVAVMKVL